MSIKKQKTKMVTVLTFVIGVLLLSSTVSLACPPPPPPSDDAPNLRGADNILVPIDGQVITKQINYIGDVDCFKFTTGAAGSYIIESVSAEPNIRAELYSFNGSTYSLIASDDNGGGGYNFKITAKLNANTTYYIIVKH